MWDGHLEKVTVCFWIIHRRGHHIAHMADHLADSEVSACLATHLLRAWMHRAVFLPLVQTCALLNHWVWQQTVRQLENKVKHNQSLLHRCTYLKLKTVNSFVTTVHYSLVYCWSGNGSDCSVDKPKTLLQWRSFGMHSSSKGLCIQPDKVQISQ